MAKAAPAKSNPFPGLRPFRENEERLFFGREGQVDSMVGRLARTRFLAVLGTSGSGKSSLVNCGLKPALHRGLMGDAGSNWRIAQFRPGRKPVHALAEALSAADLLFPESEPGHLPVSQMVEGYLRMSKLGVVETVRLAQLGERTNLLIVADQFEELFRYRDRSEDGAELLQEAVAFVNLLLEAAKQREYPIYVVLTMRSDFLGDCSQFHGLPEAINDGQFLVPRLTRSERRAAISGPIAVVDGTISPVLLTKLVNDVGDNPDQLSILQHALNRTWSYWRHEAGGLGPLELAHYIAVGEMSGALNLHAEKAYGELTSDREKAICRKVFQALTDTGTDARGIRRPTPFGALCEIAEASAEEVEKVLAVFRKPSRSFLLPPIGVALTPETMIDISHESLMRVWTTLRKWADEEAESAQLYRRLSDAAARLETGQANLWSGVELELGLAWRKRERPNAAWAALYGGGFERSIEFLAASELERDRIEQLKAEAHERELAMAGRLAQAKARDKSLRRMVAGALVAVAICAGFAVWALKQSQRAIQAEHNAEVQKHQAEENANAATKLAVQAETSAKNAKKNADEAVAQKKLADQETERAKAAERKALDASEKLLLSSADSLITQLAAREDKDDVGPLRRIYSANPEFVKQILTVAFTEKDAMRKVLQRGFHMRIALNPQNAERKQLIEKALETYCTKQGLENLHRAGACVVIGRMIYPPKLEFVRLIEGAFLEHWRDWENQIAYPPSPENAALYRDEVNASFGGMLDMLTPGDARQFCEGMLEKLPATANAGFAMKRAASRLSEQDANRLSIAIFQRAVKATGDDVPRLLESAKDLGINASAAQSLAFSKQALEQARAREPKAPWILFGASMAGKQNRPADNVQVARLMLELEPEGLAPRDRLAWSEAFRLMVAGSKDKQRTELLRWVVKSDSARAKMAAVDGAVPKVDGQPHLANTNWIALDDRAAMFGGKLPEVAITEPFTADRLMTEVVGAIRSMQSKLLTTESQGEFQMLASLQSFFWIQSARPKIVAAIRGRARAVIPALKGPLDESLEKAIQEAMVARLPNKPIAGMKLAELRAGFRSLMVDQIKLFAQNHLRKDLLGPIAERQTAQEGALLLPEDGTEIGAEYRKVVMQVMPAERSILASLEGRSDELTKKEVDECAIQLADYLRSHHRSLTLARAFQRGLDILMRLRPSGEAMSAAITFLMNLEEPERSKALCWESGKGLPALMNAWGDSVPESAMLAAIKWNSCSQGTYMSLAQTLVARRKADPIEAGVRNGYLLLEQFRAWAEPGR